MNKIIETDRLILRTWIASDLEPMSAIHKDHNVMKYLGGIKDACATAKYIETLEKHYDTHGYTLYATEKKSTGDFIGFIGIRFADYLKEYFNPAPEIAWRLSYKHWGKGYATEGAKAVLQYAFNDLSLFEVISLASECNQRSLRVMQKIGLKHNRKDDFDHPKLDDENPLKRHVLYRLSREEYLQGESP